MPPQGACQTEEQDGSPLLLILYLPYEWQNHYTYILNRFENYDDIKRIEDIERAY